MLLRFSLRYLAGALAFPLADFLLPGLHCADIRVALMAGAVLMLLYLLIRPVARLLSLALNLLTLGLLGMVIDSLLILLAAALLPGLVRVDSLTWAIAAALIINLVRGLAGRLVTT